MNGAFWTILVTVLGTAIVLIGTILGTVWHSDAKREADLAEFRQDIKDINAKREADWIRLDAKREADWKDLHTAIDKVNELYANMSGRLDALFNQPR